MLLIYAEKKTILLLIKVMNKKRKFVYYTVSFKGKKFEPTLKCSNIRTLTSIFKTYKKFRNFVLEGLIVHT
jgi:hypothetical protein